jgi:hypothetical protein
LHDRDGNDTFIQVIGEKEIIWSNAYIYAGNFPESAISFDKFADKLGTLPNVDRENISWSTSMEGVNVIATYKYGGNNRFRLALLGCTSDDNLGTRKETHDAVLALAAEWDSEVVG